MTPDEEIKKLKELLAQFMYPIKDAPYPIVMEVITGHPVIAFEPNDKKDIKLLKELRQALQHATQNAHETGIIKLRSNEVGNAIEPFVKEALNNVGVKASTPENSQGKSKLQDILIYL